MRTTAVGGAVVVIGLLAGCGSSGVHKQDASSTTPSSASSTPRSSSTSASPAPSWTPPAYGTAQPAVDAYLALDDAYNTAFRDPAHVPASTFDKYLIGDAKTLFDAALFNTKRAGEFYMGTPALQRIRVASANLRAQPKTVVLTSCPLASATDAFSGYYVATGKPVPTAAPKVPPPYLHTMKMIYLNGQWMLETFMTTSTKTCTP